MFNKQTIQEKLFGLVGFQNPANPEYAIVDTENEASSTGRYFTDNPFCKIEYIKDTQDYAAITDEEFNNYLGKVQQESIVSVCDKVFNESDYIDRQMLFQNANNKTDVDSLPDGFVGYRIYVDKEKNLAFEIRRILLEFQGTGDLTIYLFNSAKTEAIYSQQVTISSSFQELVLDWKVDNQDYYKGEFYLGYFTDSLTVKPYKREYQGANIKSVVTYLNIENIKVTTATGTNLFDLDDVDGAEETWGINPDISTYYDYTDLIVNNKTLLSYAIQMQGQLILLHSYLASLRSNRNERMSTQYINRVIVEIDGFVGNDVKRIGIKPTLAAEVTRLRQELFKLQAGYMQKGILNITRS